MDLTNITEEKLIIISDTHIGSIYENLSYLDTVYNYASKKSIHHLLHTGDLIQSTYRNNNKKYYNEEKQIEHLLLSYPSSSITNHIIYGNHDYNTIHKNPYYHEMITSRPDFHILGTKTSYISWNDNIICLHHHCPRYRITIPNLQSLITFCGHSHHLEIKGNIIQVPTLSDDLKELTNPGFLISTLTSTSLIVEHYDLITREQDLVLEKKI